MAKMFYTIEEAAERLGVSQDQVKQLATGGKLQQFRDRDKLMFKREQVDALALKAGTAGGSGPVPLAGSGDTDTGPAKGDSHHGQRKEDPRQATGISVFDADEITPADPLSQTQVTQPMADDELALESVGSGSGLLDLTRESDDTSLGAELLDEIYPGSGGTHPSDIKVDSVAGSVAGLAPEAAEGSGLAGMPVQPMPVMMSGGEPFDGGGSGLGVGMLIGATVALVLVLMAALAAVTDSPSSLTAAMAQSGDTVMLYSGIVLAGSLVLGAAGFFIGKAVSR
jgi:excisionase family DNA binding protein